MLLFGFGFLLDPLSVCLFWGQWSLFCQTQKLSHPHYCASLFSHLSLFDGFWYKSSLVAHATDQKHVMFTSYISVKDLCGSKFKQHLFTPRQCQTLQWPILIHSPMHCVVVSPNSDPQFHFRTLETKDSTLSQCDCHHPRLQPTSQNTRTAVQYDIVPDPLSLKVLELYFGKQSVGIAGNALFI